MASGKHGFCHKHLLYLKFKNTFYLVSRLQPKWSPWQGLSPLGASSWGRGKRPRPGRNRSSDPCQYSRVPQQHHSVPLPAVGDRSLHRGHFPHGAGAAPGNACPGPWGTALDSRGGEEHQHRPQLRVWTALVSFILFLGAEFPLYLVLLSLGGAAAGAAPHSVSDVGVNYNPSCTANLKALLPVIYLNTDKLYISLVIHVKIIWSQLNITYLRVLSRGKSCQTALPSTLPFCCFPCLWVTCGWQRSEGGSWSRLTPSCWRGHPQGVNSGFTRSELSPALGAAGTFPLSALPGTSLAKATFSVPAWRSRV